MKHFDLTLCLIFPTGKPIYLKMKIPCTIIGSYGYIIEVLNILTIFKHRALRMYIFIYIFFSIVSHIHFSLFPTTFPHYTNFFIFGPEFTILLAASICLCICCPRHLNNWSGSHFSLNVELFSSP